MKKYLRNGLLVAACVCLTAAGSIALKIASMEREGCTSWAAIGTALDPAIRDTTVLLHKNRDMSDVHTMEVTQFDYGTYRYLAVAGCKKSSPAPAEDKMLVWAGVNERGLAAASNYVGGVNLFGTMGGASFCREILENCSSVDEAYDFIAAKKSKFYSGNLMFLADPNKIAVVEAKVWLLGTVKISARSDAVVEGASDRPPVVYRTNHYCNLTNYVPIPSTDDTIARYNRLAGLMNSSDGALYGTLNRDLCRMVSRLENGSGKDGFCKTSTLARITLEIDKQSPSKSKIWYGPGYNDSLPDGGHCSDEAMLSYSFSMQ
jgi:hypothetical protein